MPFQVGPTLKGKEINAALSLIPVSQYVLTVLNAGDGTTSPSGSTTVDHGSATNISATPAVNHQFANWTVTSGAGAALGDVDSSTATVARTARDATIQANLVVAQHVNRWFTSDVETPKANHDVKITLNVDGTYETLLHDVGGSTPQSGSSRGTNTWNDGIASAQQTELYNGSAWVPCSGTPPPAACSVSEDGNTLTRH